ncbi:MAG: hypothetical protein DMD91_16370 [Candidatus Rokuibacteriota bacterium]|nr:MAG: hypothetical protein DMD91_16370 [Candidatus Rokubacteria bacterium]
MQAFITAAAAMGLGCCPISVVRNHVEKLAELLELPSGVFPARRRGSAARRPEVSGRRTGRRPRPSA